MLVPFGSYKSSTMRKTIILPTDFSDNARNAYHYAFSLFGSDNVRYILFNSYDIPYSRMDMITKFEEVLADIAIRGLETELAYCRDLYPHLDAEIIVTSAYGEFSDCLQKLVLDEHANFIVMGTKGASGLDKVFLGSNAAKVIQRVNCPTITVPKGVRYQTPSRIAFASDYMKLSDKTLMPLRYLATITDAKLLIFKIETNAAADYFKSVTNENYVHPTLEGLPQSFTTISEDDVVEGIEHFVSSHDADLLAMVARQHHFFDRIFHRSVTRQIALEFEKVALLILHQ